MKPAIGTPRRRPKLELLISSKHTIATKFQRLFLCFHLSHGTNQELWGSVERGLKVWIWTRPHHLFCSFSSFSLTPIHYSSLPSLSYTAPLYPLAFWGITDLYGISADTISGSDCTRCLACWSGPGNLKWDFHVYAVRTLSLADI